MNAWATLFAPVLTNNDKPPSEDSYVNYLFYTWRWADLFNPEKQVKNAVYLGDNIVRVRLGTCQELLPSRGFLPLHDPDCNTTLAQADRNFLAALDRNAAVCGGWVQRGTHDPDVLYLFYNLASL